MKTPLACFIAICLLGFVFAGCASHDDNPLASRQESRALDSAAALTNIFSKIEIGVPELKLLGSSTNHGELPSDWKAEASGVGGFNLRNNPWESPDSILMENKTKPPGFFLIVIISKFASSKEADQTIEKERFHRPVFPESKGNYQNGVIFGNKDSSVNIWVGGKYIIEIDSDGNEAIPLIDRVMDVTIDQIHKANLGSLRCDLEAYLDRYP